MNVRRGFVTQVGMDGELFARAADAGYDYVELMLDGEWAREAIKADPARLREPLDEHGLDLLVHPPNGR
jgi:sugar phosphate isomerase/epimerase